LVFSLLFSGLVPVSFLSEAHSLLALLGEKTGKKLEKNMYSTEYGRDAQSAFSDLNPDPSIAGLASQNPGGPANASLCDVLNPVNGQAGTRYDQNITIYSSPDLTDGSWELLRREGLPLAGRPLGQYYRPKVVFNALTGKYVLWGFYCSTATGPGQAGPVQNCVYYNALSASPGGPFQIADFTASSSPRPPRRRRWRSGGIALPRLPPLPLLPLERDSTPRGSSAGAPFSISTEGERHERQRERQRGRQARRRRRLCQCPHPLLPR
jgi:hypothetical protein